MTASPKKRLLSFTLGAIALLLALIVASFFDLSIATKITDQENRLGRIVQDYGTLPQGALIVCAVLILTIPGLRLGYPLLARCSSALIAQALLHPLSFCTPLKFLWGRTRPADLLAGGLEFTPFYVLNPGGHGLSFPSGHVAAAMALAPVVYLLFRAGKNRLAIVASLVTVLWAGTVAYGRMLYGAHFLTDVLFSIGTAILFVPLSIKVGDWYLTKYEHKSAG